MHDPWIARISDSIDGQLAEAEEQALRAHLDGCAACRRVESELRSVVAAAQAAQAAEPARDLWPGIAAAITRSAAGETSAAAAQHDMGASVTPLHGGRRVSRESRRFSFSVPQLAAAAVVLMAVSGAAVWVVSTRPDSAALAAGTIIQSSGGQPRSTQMAATRGASAEYTEDVADLERALEASRGQLDPATVEVIERSLESIDLAIDDARSALAADPGNPYLHRQLDNTMRKKIDVLRRATGAQRARS